MFFLFPIRVIMCKHLFCNELWLTTFYAYALFTVHKIWTMCLPVLNMIRLPMSIKISDVCEISDLLLFVSYFASQNKEIKFGNYVLMCAV